MFSIVGYCAPERLTSPITGLQVVKRNLRTYEEATAEVKRMPNFDRWKITGFNEEQEYFWGRKTSPSRRRRTLRIEQ